MESLLQQYFGELVVSGVLAALVWAIKSWAHRIEQSTTVILAKLNTLHRDFNQHRVEVERRVTRVETKVDLVHKDAIKLSDVEARN